MPTMPSWWPWKRERLIVPSTGRLSITETIVERGGSDWAPPNYGDYYAKSVPLYAAVKLRADAITRAPLLVWRRLRNGDEEPVGPEHPYQQLLNRVNADMTADDLLRATSTFLDLYGACFWLLTKASESSQPTEIWPVRPDLIKVLKRHRQPALGFILREDGRETSLLPSEVVWFRQFNPFEENAGFSPVAPLRLSADMGIDALKHNRNVFTNRLMFDDSVIKAELDPTEEEIESFYARLKKRFATPENSWRPFVLGRGMDVKKLGGLPKDMEYLAALRWTVEDVSRVFGVPKLLLGDLERSTFSNFAQAERIFWRVMVTHMSFIEGEINEMLSPQFGSDLFVRFDLGSIEALQEDRDALSKRMLAEVERGVRTINEARAEIGLEPVEWGDTWWAPATVLPVGNTPTEAEREPSRAYIASRRGWTDKELDAWVVEHVRALSPREQRWDRMQQRLFARQRRDVLARLREAKAFTRQTGDVLFDPDRWVDMFIRDGQPLMEQGVKAGADAQVLRFGLGISFDVSRPVVQDWISDRTRFWATRVNEETARLITAEIAEAAELGESIPQMQERIEKVFAFSDNVRSERIARTETVNAVNRGSIEAYRQSEVVEAKQWIATLDERTREAHLDAHLQTVPLDAEFFVMGEYIPHPGAGRPENAINCRCTVVPIVKRPQKAIAAPASNGRGVLASG